MFYSIKLFGPDLSIGKTEGVRIITKHASKLSCVSLANHEMAVSSENRGKIVPTFNFSEPGLWITDY